MVRSRRILFIFALCLTLQTPASSCFAEVWKDLVINRYGKVCDELERYGFLGPIAGEIAEHALLRQIYEDGTRRKPSISMVGMVPGGLNKLVLQELGLKHRGVKLKRIKANDGLGTYAFYGKDASLVSAVAIGLLLDKYIETLSKFSKRDKAIWRASKRCSKLIRINHADAEHLYRFRGLAKPRRRILTRANSVYGPKAYLLNRLTRKHADAFASAKLAHELKSLCSFGHYPYGLAPIARCYPLCKWVYSPDLFLEKLPDPGGLFGNLY
jgi:hypothetical protein